MGLGWTGSYGATGAADALADILKQREAMKQREFENALKLRQADRDDRELTIKEQQIRAAGSDKTQVDGSRALGELPIGAKVYDDDPIAPVLDAGGRGGPAFMTPVAATLPSTQTAPSSQLGANAPMVSGQLRLSPSDPAHRIVGGTSKQVNDLQGLDMRGLRLDQQERDLKLRGDNQDLKERDAEYRRTHPRPILVADPDNPGRMIFMDPGQAMGQNGPDPGAVRTQAINNTVAMEEMDELKRLFKPEYVGPGTAMWTQFKQKIPGTQANPDAVRFYAQSAKIKNAVILATTGAAVGVEESKRILREVPTEDDKAENWPVKFEQSYRNLQVLNRIIAGKGGTPVTLNGADPGVTPPRNDGSMMFAPGAATPPPPGPITGQLQPRGTPPTGRLVYDDDPAPAPAAAPPPAARPSAGLSPAAAPQSLGGRAQAAADAQPKTAQNKPNVIKGIDYNAPPYRTYPNGRIAKYINGKGWMEVEVER